MAQIIVAGLGEKQTIHLVRSRAPEGALKAGEYPHKDKSGKVIAYRKDLPKEANGSPKAIEWVKLNRIIAKEWPDTGNGKNWSFSLVVSNQTGSHRIDMGGGMLATNVVNSFLSLMNKSPEEIAELTFRISFYHNKGTGYNSCSVTDNTGARLDWYMSNDEAKSYIKTAPNPVDPTKTLVNKEALMVRYMELVEALNPLLPKTHLSTGSALDGIEDDMDENVGWVTEADAEELFGDNKAQDKPFEV